jgi:hypothetical protein
LYQTFLPASNKLAKKGAALATGSTPSLGIMVRHLCGSWTDGKLDTFGEQGWTRADADLMEFSFDNWARAAGPALLFGLRLWASVSLALYVAFWLELDNPFWAGTSAAIVASHSLAPRWVPPRSWF